ncbi:MAG: VWA domain-containing protein [Microcoleus sp. SM1_3_4]|nr:VWA domain-containing protein [Microcoleus sp. SM1_3_4]
MQFDDVLLGSAVDASAIELLEGIKGDSILSYASDTRSASQLGGNSSFISTFDGLGGQVGSVDPSGKFNQISSSFSFYDIAVSKDEKIFGITPTQLYKIDPASGLTSFVGELRAGVNINALEFANDVLYAAGDSNLYTINTSNGAASLVANLGNGFNSSGDLVFDAANNRFLATSRGDGGDNLFAVSLTGQATKIGDIGINNVWGLLFEDGKLLGFTADGKRIAIDPATGRGAVDGNIAGISTQIGGASGLQFKKGEILSSTPGTILSADTIDVFLPPGGEITLEITVTVPGDASSSTSRSGLSVESVAPLAAQMLNSSVVSASATADQLPLDVFLLQDASSSFNDDLSTFRGLVPTLVNTLLNQQPNTRFGLGSFVDKPKPPFGNLVDDDYVYRTNLSLTQDTAALQSTVNNLTTRRAGTTQPEAQLEALLQTALRADSRDIGFRSNARRAIVVATDAPFHQAGDGRQAGITTPNNLDTILDGNPPGTGEDYPSVPQVRQALIDANLVPVFAVTEDQIATYRDLVDDSDGDGFGFGSVVELDSDSSNLVDAITTGLDVVGREINVVPVSDEFGYVKEITPPKFTDVLPGQKLTFRVKLKSDGKGGNDTLSLRALGFGDTKINIRTSNVNQIVENPNQVITPTEAITANFVDSDTDKKLKDEISRRINEDGSGKDERLDEGVKLLPYGQLPNDLDLDLNQPQKREVSLKSFSPSLTSTPINSTEAKKTWVIIHGLNDNPDDNPENNGDFSDIAKALTTKTNDNVFLLDWRQAAAGGKVDKKDDPLNALRRLGNYTAAKWIRPVAEFAVKKLKELGIDSESASKSLNLVGHSLGSLLSNEIARIYKNGFKDKDGETKANGIGVNSILALDPPSQLNLTFLSNASTNTKIGYDIDGRTPEADFVDPFQGIYLPKFREVSNFSRAFVGSKSLAGNQLFAEQAHESFQMDFGARPGRGGGDTGEEHTWVVQSFKQFIDKSDSLGEIGKLFNPNPSKQILNPSPNFKENAYTNALGAKHDGSIAVEPPKDNNLPQPKALIFTNTSGDKDDIVYGTAGDDKLDSSNNALLLLGGDSRYSAEGNDIFYANAGNDTIFGGSGNDTIYGDRDNDFINGEEDNDIIEGGDDNDKIFGAKGDDTVIGGKGNDSLEGNADDDTLIGGKGKDNLTGGFGSDIFVFSPGDGAASRDEADIITDFGTGFVGRGGADRIGLAGDLKADSIELETFGGGIFGIGERTALKLMVSILLFSTVSLVKTI